MADDLPPHPGETIRRIGGYLHRVAPVLEEGTGRVLHVVVSPLRVELHARDLMQIVFGALFLTLPVAMAEGAWLLAERIPGRNIALLAMLSVLIISVFVYTHTYHGHLRAHWGSFFKRVVVTYLLSALVAATVLALFEECPLLTEPLVALRRIIFVTFPASMAATVYDSLK